MHGFALILALTQGVVAQAPVEETQPATIIVRLPAEARLYVNGQQTTSTGDLRTLETPAIKVNSIYEYTMEAQLDQNGETIVRRKVVSLSGGTRKNVVFNFPVAQAAEILPETTTRNYTPEFNPVPSPQVPSFNPPVVGGGSSGGMFPPVGGGGPSIGMLPPTPDGGKIVQKLVPLGNGQFQKITVNVPNTGRPSGMSPSPFRPNFPGSGSFPGSFPGSRPPMRRP